METNIDMSGDEPTKNRTKIKNKSFEVNKFKNNLNELDTN